MDNSSPPASAPTSPSVSQPFKNWQESFKALKSLPRQPVDTDREDYIERITASQQKKQIAFEMLHLIQTAKYAAKIRWLEMPMLHVLGDGEEDPKLATRATPSEAKNWVFRRLDGVRTFNEWRRFLESGKHLWVLHVILKAGSNKQVLIESLTALAECVENCQTSKSASKKKVSVTASDAEWITKLIKARIPAKLDLPNAFIETLFAINATAALSDALRKESSGLHSRLEIYEEALSSERQARTAAEESVADLQAKLDTALAEVETKTKELEEQRLHNTRQGGFNVVARSETINQVMAAVRQGTLHRLENIRAYADRETPDREEIVALVTEIEKHLNRIEEVVSQ